MKNTIYVMSLAIFLVLQACTKNDDDQEPKSENQEPTVEISPNQMIVRFDATVTEEDRIAIREESNVTDFEKCDCGNENIELWGIDTDVIDIEGTIRGLKQRQRGKAEGDYQFSFTLPAVANFQIPNDIDPSDIVNSVSGATEPEIVNIAVIDTGLDYMNYFESGGILYQEPGAMDCEPDDAANFHTSGWNFVDNSGISLDKNGHGTYVTQLITSILKERGIGYRILPIQAFDQNGEGSLWNIICAIGYIQRVQAEGGMVHIVNTSFGGTIEKERFESDGLLSTMIAELQNEVLFVASAGNEGLDTDNSNLRHFPSGFTAENMLAVGGYLESGSDINLHPESNYGKLSIDIAVPFEGYSIQLESSSSIDLRGTSYSAARISALVSEYYINNDKPNPINLKNQFLNTATVISTLNDSINGGRIIR